MLTRILMPKQLTVFVLIVLIFLSAAPGMQEKKARRISRQVLEDKIRGGWAGQMIGVSFGAPTEFKSNGKIIEGELPWSPERISNSIRQDDLYVDMTLAEVLDRIGLDARTEQFGEAFKNTKYSLWHANASARRWLNNGIKAPWSGHPKYNIHANDIDFQIESDFIGLMTPGLPQESNHFCDRVGRVMNYGDGLYGGMFVCGMYAAAFFESNARRVVEQGLACIPADSGYGQIISDLLKWHTQYPDDWKKTWQLITGKWDKNDPCPDGALRAFNIDAKLNGAFIGLGLLYGGGDFSKTVEITTRCGQDSDCNPSNAAGILGVMIGYQKIPESWKAGIPAIADTKFEFTNYSFDEIVPATVQRALKVVTKAGGHVTDTELIIPYQVPKAPKLEQWNPGVPDRLVDTTDPSWIWKGSWVDEAARGRLVGKLAETAGAEAVLTFTGSAVAVVGLCTREGGRADVYLDGNKAREINASIVDRTSDNDLWHTYDLKPTTHTLKIITRGKKVLINRAIVYR